MHAIRVVWRELRRARALLPISCHAANALGGERHVRDVAAVRGGRPAAAPEHFEQLLAAQRIGRHYMAHELHAVIAADSRAEGGCADIADPMRDAALPPRFRGERLHGRGRQVREQPFGYHQRGLQARRHIECAPLGHIVNVRGEALTAAPWRFARHQPFLIIQHAGEIDFDPSQIRREVQPPC